MRKNEKKINQNLNNAENALIKAKESWQKALEWWKEFWKWMKWVVVWTVEAVWNLIKAWYEISSAWVEKVIDKINEKNNSKSSKNEESNSQEHIDKAWESLQKAWKWVKDFWKWLVDTVFWFAKWVWQWVKSWFHIADAWDKKLWEKVKNSEIKNEKLKKTAEIWASNVFKTLYIWWLATLLTLWGKWIAEKAWKDEDKTPDKIEETVDTTTENDENTIDIQYLMENPYWNNPDYFDATKTVEKDEQYIDQWITLIRDVWMTFYVITLDDIQYDEIVQKNGKKTKKASRTKTINHLRKKLWAIPEFDYLNNDEYEPKPDDVTKTFNMRTDFESYLKDHPNTYYIPIPMNSVDRKINDKAFYYYANEWIAEVCNDSIYWDYWKKIMEKIPEEKISLFITAIAKVETWATFATIWTDEYYRRENGSHNCYSFGPHHVLMEKSGKTAYTNLVKNWHFSTEWQTYHPKNSTIWVAWFIAEKSNFKAESMIKRLSFLNKKVEDVTPDDLRRFAEFYNWDKYEQNDYHTKFCKAYKNISKNI